MEVKIRTIIVIDADMDLHGETPKNFCGITNEQLANGELPVDEYLSFADDVTIVTIPIGESND